MIALQHASAGKTGTPRGVSLTFSSLIVANMLIEAVYDVVTFLLALMLQWWMLNTIFGWRTLLVIFLGNMLFSCAAAAVMVLMGALKAGQQKCPTKSWSFFDYCCIASAADLWCSRLASYTEFGMGKRSCWHCAYRYYFRYQAAPMEKNRSSRIRFCKTVFFSFEQKALRTSKALC